MTDKTAIQRIQELDRERAELFAQAKEEALRRATQAVEDLNALGLKYRLVEDEPPAASKAVGKAQQKGQAEKKSAARPPG
jgi:1,6-anhydro-N-acetylmuramate kinase